MHYGSVMNASFQNVKVQSRGEILFFLPARIRTVRLSVCRECCQHDIFGPMKARCIKTYILYTQTQSAAAGKRIFQAAWNTVEPTSPQPQNCSIFLQIPRPNVAEVVHLPSHRYAYDFYFAKIC